MHIPASDLHIRTPDQDEIESAPCITFGQFRRLAKRREWSEKYLAEQTDLDTATIRRALTGTPVNGHHDKLESTVIPYWPLIELYQQHS
jgi:hypothetical protein